jgi:integrase
MSLMSIIAAPSRRVRRVRRRGKGEGSIYPRKSAGGVLYIQWVDETGRTRIRSSKTRDRSVAQKILAKTVERVRLLQEGVVTREDEARRLARQRDIFSHLSAYMKDCDLRGQNARAMLQKRRNLEQWFSSEGIRCLDDCSAECLTEFLTKRQSQRRGRGAASTGARVWNQIRTQAVAFMSWCRKRGFCVDNPLEVVVRRDERQDARRKRRALSSDEVKRLLAVAQGRGREAWYLAALRVGMRKSDLKRLDWSNVEFGSDGNGQISFPIQKAKRQDILPMDKVLAAALKKRWMDAGSPRTGLVFPTTVTDRTRKRDFVEAGIPLRDAGGRVVDLHSCRMTLVMALVRNHAPIQVASKMMRHKDLKTTMSYYTDFVAEDLRKDYEKAVAAL